MGGQTKQHPQPEVCYTDPAEEQVQATQVGAPAPDSNGFQAQRLGLAPGEDQGAGATAKHAAAQARLTKVPTDVAGLVEPAPFDQKAYEQAEAARRVHIERAKEVYAKAQGGMGPSHPYWKEKIGKHNARAEEAAKGIPERQVKDSPIGSNFGKVVDGIGVCSDVVDVATGVQQLGSNDGLEQAEGAAKVTAGTTGAASAVAGWSAKTAAAAPALGAVSTGLTAAAIAHEGGDHHIRERELLGGDGAADWASQGDSVGEVALRSVGGAALEVASAPAGIADASSQKLADAVLVYSGQDGPKDDRSRAPRNPEESAMLKESGKRPYSEEAWAAKPSMWNMLTNSYDGPESGIVPGDSGTLIENYVHPENGPWVDPQIAIREEQARQAECDRLEASGQAYEQVVTNQRGQVTGGASIAPGGKAPGPGHCAETAD